MRGSRLQSRRLTLLLVALSVIILMLAGCTGSLPATTTTPGQSTTIGSTRITTRAATTVSQGVTTALGTTAATGSTAGTGTTSASRTTQILEDGRFSSPTDVALYLHAYRKLPRNFITKSAAAKAGWESSLGNLWDVTDHMSIGGDVFGNREGLLPSKSGRIWYECDVNYTGGFRGGERIVYSNDGLIYYSKDHYANFTKLY